MGAESSRNYQRFDSLVTVVYFKTAGARIYGKEYAWSESLRNRLSTETAAHDFHLIKRPNRYVIQALIFPIHLAPLSSSHSIINLSIKAFILPSLI